MSGGKATLRNLKLVLYGTSKMPKIQFDRRVRSFEQVSDSKFESKVSYEDFGTLCKNL